MARNEVAQFRKERRVDRSRRGQGWGSLRHPQPGEKLLEMITIQRIELPKPGMEQLLAEAREEGFLFIEWLWKQWQNGENRFDAPGEVLYGCMDKSELVAIGGINQDPFAGRSDVGRIRRVYVRPAWRRRGIGDALVHALIEHARTNFVSLHLRTDNPAAARLYERIGFSHSSIPNATHILILESGRTDLSGQFIAKTPR